MKSSVEWLVDQMLKQGYFDGNKPLSITNLDHLQHQAKEMHKKEVENGFNEGYRDGFVDGLSGFDNDQDVEKFDNANLYYNETFGVKESGMSEKPTTQTDEEIKYSKTFEKKYSEKDLKQFAWECVANFLSNDENKVEGKLVDIIIDRNDYQFKKFKKK